MWQLFAIEAQAVHAGINLDMYRHILQTFLFRRRYNLLKRGKRIDVRLKVILQDKIHGSYLGVHDNDRQSYTCAAQFNTFVGNGNCEVICHLSCLKSFADLQAACAVGEGFDHTGEFGGRFEQRAEEAHVIHQGSQVDTHDSLMGLLQNTSGDCILIVAQCTHDGRAGADVLVRGVFYHHRTMGKEFHLLCTLGFQVGKVFAMLLADVRDNAYRRTNDRLQPLHLAGHGYTCLEDCQRWLCISQVWLLQQTCQPPHTERHTNLRVVRFGRTDNAVVIFQQFVEPLFDNSLAVRAGYTNHRAGELRTHIGCQALECHKRIIHDKQDGISRLRTQ